MQTVMKIAPNVIVCSLNRYINFAGKVLVSLRKLKLFKCSMDFRVWTVNFFGGGVTIKDNNGLAIGALVKKYITFLTFLTFNNYLMISMVYNQQFVQWRFVNITVCKKTNDSNDLADNNPGLLQVLLMRGFKNQGRPLF